MAIRQATPADERALRRLQSFLTDPNEALLDAALAGAGRLLVSEGPGGSTPVGYALTIRGDRTATLAELVVAPDHRREGRATRLVKTTFAYLRERGVESVDLTVHEDDVGARTCYAGLGFTVDERLPGYFQDGSALRMVRDL